MVPSLIPTFTTLKNWKNKMSDYKNFEYVEFLRTDTPGPYGIPLKISNWGKDEILFDIDIDGVTHSFPLKHKHIENSVGSNVDEHDGKLLYVSVSIDEMAKIYSKISSIIKVEKNDFML